MADFRLNRRLNNRGRTQQAVQDAIRWRRRRALLDDTGVSYAYSTDLALWYNWTTAPNGVLSLAAQTNRNDDSSFGPTLSLTRATTASVTDYNNIIKTVASGEERFTGGRRVENLILQSNDLSTTWSNNNSTDAQTVAANPLDGTVDANSLTEDGTAGVGHSISMDNSVSTISGESYTFSVYVKANGRNHCYLYHAGANDGWYFNLTTGAVGSFFISQAPSKGIEDVGNGWYRCWITAVATVDGIGNDFDIGLADADDSYVYNGDGSSGILVYGAQVELVSGQDDPAPSEYQATTTAAVSKWYATKRRTNLILQSNDFDTSWTNFRSTEVSGLSDPDGGSNAWSLDEDGTSANNHRIEQSVTAKVGAAHTFSAYLKASNRTWATIGMRDSGASIRLVSFNLSTGAVGTTHANFESAAIEDVGNGWYRCSATMIGNGAVLARLYIAEADNDTTFDGLSQESILMYNAQLEEGTAATAYIPTTTTVASSAVDTDITVTGLLVEEARTNICLQSEDLSTTWVAGGVTTLTADQAIAPDGTLTADQIIDDSSTGSGQVVAQQSISGASNSTAYCFSIYAKADQLSQVAFDWDGWTTPVSNTQAWFNLSTGAVGTKDAGFDASGIEDAGNGWYRCWATFTTDASDSSGSIRVSPAQTDNVIDVDLDGTSSIFVWGAQLEAGSFPTSYIPTVAASVTRNLDEFTTTDVTWLDQTQSSVYVSGIQPFPDVAHQVPWEIGKDATDRWFLNVTTTDGGLDFSTKTGTGTDGVINGTQTVTADTLYRYAVGIANDDLSSYADGSSNGVDTSATVPSSGTFTSLHVGRTSTDTFPLNGHIAEIAYYNTRRVDATLDDMSTNGPGEGAEE